LFPTISGSTQIQSKLISEISTVKTNPCFSYEGKTGEERNLVIFKDTPMNNYMNGDLSARPLIGLSLKITKLRFRPVSLPYPKQVWDYLKQGLNFIVRVPSKL